MTARELLQQALDVAKIGDLSAALDYIQRGAQFTLETNYRGWPYSMVIRVEWGVDGEHLTVRRNAVVALTAVRNALEATLECQFGGEDQP